MMKTFILFNLLIALVFLPVTQAFAGAVDASSMHNQHSETAHCEQMDAEQCEPHSDCPVTGLHCGSIITAILFEEKDLIIGNIKGMTRTRFSQKYRFIFHLPDLRPPRII